MLENLEFNLDGINSYEKGVVNVHLNNGLTNENFLAPSNVITEKIRGRSEPYLMDVSYDVITIPLVIYFDEGFDKKKLREIASWIRGDSSNYRPFYFLEDTDRLFYVIYSGEPRLSHNGSNGYVEITFLTSAPYAFSKTVSTITRNVQSDKIVVLDNIGDLNIKPELQIEKVGHGDVIIKNHTNKGEYLEIIGLQDQETVYIDNDMEDIVSSLEGDGVYRYDSTFGDFLELVKGKNEIEVIGDCNIHFRYRHLLIQG